MRLLCAQQHTEESYPQLIFYMAGISRASYLPTWQNGNAAALKAEGGFTDGGSIPPAGAKSPVSSAGQSIRLITGKSWVRFPDGGPCAARAHQPTYQGRRVAPSMRRSHTQLMAINSPGGDSERRGTLPLCGREKMGLLLSCEVAAPLCGDHEANCSKVHGADCGKTLYRATLERLMGPEKGMAPACHGGGSGGSYDLPRRYPAENYPHCDALKR